nr:calmodulin-binding receptor-like cytoplasmic kinase 3 isoform X1 [Ziziphus jujuba var. spinosa]
MDITVWLGLLVLVQLPTLYASGFLIESEVCGGLIAYSTSSGHEVFSINGNSVEVCGGLIAYSTSSGYEVFSINGNSVDRDLFCEALQIYNANGCILEGYLGSNPCRVDLLAADNLSETGRKLLQEDSRDEPTVHDHKKIYRRGGNDSKTVSTPKTFGMVAAGAFLACCLFLCPCFHRKRKNAAHSVLEKDPHSKMNGSVPAVDSTTSFGVNSPAENIKASPLRIPASPKFSASPKLSRLGSVHLNLNQVARATRNFSPSLQIGEGGFGTVYRAQLDDGQVVAIKRAKKEYFENLRTEFSSEIDLLAKIDHRNLVKLLGYVDKGNERLIITEYVPNGTLREHLDGIRGKILDFNQRLEIAIDVAHGLTYLHLYAEKQIIHRDVKASNILLTESMRAKVADFGFARLGPMDSDQTHISTKVKGTVGYLDPEYMRTYQLTPKSDVYSFGVLLIEIISGRRPVELKRPVDERVTLRWAFNKFNEGSVAELVDPSMGEVVDAEVLTKMLELAIQCAAPIRADRPDMKSVGEQLWAIRADYVRSTRRG